MTTQVEDEINVFRTKDIESLGEAGGRKRRAVIRGGHKAFSY